MSDKPFYRQRMQSPAGAERQPTPAERRRMGIPPPSQPSQPVPPVKKVAPAMDILRKGIQRLKGDPNHESHAYDWRQRQGLKRGRG